MNASRDTDTAEYRKAMGKLLVLYTQVDRLIMHACAERIATAPDEPAKLALAKQVGDESRHVAIQRSWMEIFCTDSTPVFSPTQESAILDHFRKLDWLDFLTDMYLCVEALGSDAVEKIVPLADPGTRESLHIPLEDELDHIAFGVNRLKQELATMPQMKRKKFLARIPERLESLNRTFHEMNPNIRDMFEAVGADYDELRRSVLDRRNKVIEEICQPLAA
jgi:hypothetical protein